MKRNVIVLCIASLILSMINLTSCSLREKSIQILLLSGSNNHDWKTTTPFLEHMYLEAEVFRIDITERPDTLSPEKIKKYDAIVSNWNSWPENELRWNPKLEEAIIKYVRDGGGLVFFHASTSVFYNWDEFRELTVASWEEYTGHDKPDTVEVIIENREHPITKWIANFKLVDELWINARKNDNFVVLGSATDKTLTESGKLAQPAIFVKEEGKGRIFHTILGHDVEAMKSEGFRQLMLNGTQWAATGKVTME